MTYEYRPLVSVLTQTLNGVTFLKECVESILKQSYPNIEHIIADGGSTDGTVELLTEYAHKYPGRVRYVSEPDKGVGDAWNKGFRMSKGEILGWIGSDDRYEPEAVEHVVQFFRSNRDACFLYGGVNFIDEHGGLIRTIEPEAFDLGILINSHCVIKTPSAFYKREVFEKAGGIDVLGNDFDFFIRAAKLYKIHRINEVLACFRVHTRSATAGSNKKIMLLWKREDAKVSRKHGGRFWSGYRKRYYRLFLIEGLRPIIGPVYPFLKRLRNILS